MEIKTRSGELGKGTASSKLKGLYHKEGQAVRHMSLKEFAREQVKAGNLDAQEWFSNKRKSK